MIYENHLDGMGSDFVLYTLAIALEEREITDTNGNQDKISSTDISAG